MIVYHVQDVVKRYPKQTKPANDHITLEICQGEALGILGKNGAGKTTLVRQMVNLARSTSGSIALFGQDIVRYPQQVSMNVGYMPQNGHALSSLTVGEACFFTAHLRGMTRVDAFKERDKLLELWQIAELRTRYISRLSGGQLRLLQLALAMAGEPPVLILDEPTNDLDPQYRKLVWDIFRRANREQGVTVILITHNLLEAEKLIQRVGIIDQGRLVALSRLDEMKRALQRLELLFAPETLPKLPAGLTHFEAEPGHWIVMLEQAQTDNVLRCLDASQHSAYRLSSPTLEDLYVYYTAQS
jgi:ABC-2 type transport system ATP-binding protein